MIMIVFFVLYERCIVHTWRSVGNKYVGCRLYILFFILSVCVVLWVRLLFFVFVTLTLGVHWLELAGSATLLLFERHFCVRAERIS